MYRDPDRVLCLLRAHGDNVFTRLWFRHCDNIALALTSEESRDANHLEMERGVCEQQFERPIWPRNPWFSSGNFFGMLNGVDFAIASRHAPRHQTRQKSTELVGGSRRIARRVYGVLRVHSRKISGEHIPPRLGNKSS